MALRVRIVLLLALPLGGCIVVQAPDPALIADPYAVVGPPSTAPGCPHPAAAALAGAVQGGGAGAVIGSFGGTAEDVRHGAAIGAGLGAVAGLAAAAAACPPPD